MFKRPIDYKKEELHEIEHKLMRIEIGSAQSNEITEVIEGTIYECYLAANAPYLPVRANILTKNGDKRSFDFFEMKRFSEIE